MLKITHDVSTKLRKILEPGFLQKFFLIFGNLFLDEWQKQSASTKYWRGGGARIVGRASSFKAVASKLTVRSGTLIGSLQKGAGDSIRNVTAGENKFTMSLGSRVVYAARQEYQNSGARSYVRRAFEWMKQNKLDKFKRQAIKETLS
jgi:hypothetical protein